MTRWTPICSIHSVDDLYARKAKLDVPGYYEQGEENPWAGLCRIIPRKAKAYAVVLEGDAAALSGAMASLKGFAGRRKIRQTVCDKDTANYNQFSKPGKVVVVYV